jgi:hypothetical protein
MRPGEQCAMISLVLLMLELSAELQATLDSVS